MICSSLNRLPFICPSPCGDELYGNSWGFSGSTPLAIPLGLLATYIFRDYTWQRHVIAQMATGGWWVGRVQRGGAFDRPWTLFAAPVDSVVFVRNRQQISPDLVQAEEYYLRNPLDDENNDSFDEFFLTDCKQHRHSIVDPLSLPKLDTIKWEDLSGDLFTAICRPSRVPEGWYLLAPPVRKEHEGCHPLFDHMANGSDDASCVLDDTAQLSTWDDYGSFDSAESCENLRAMGIQGVKDKERQLSSPNSGSVKESLMWLRVKTDEASRCVASDDPRLNKK